MTALDDDIARVAAMRGRSVASVEAAAQQRRAAALADTDRLSRIVDTMLAMPPAGTQDMAWYDVLPQRVRAFLQEADAETDFPQSAAAWAWGVHEWGDIDTLIDAVRRRLATLPSG